ncbi:MAG: hypothetical protein RR185_10035, partial [Angelakisella sp.]
AAFIAIVGATVNVCKISHISLQQSFLIAIISELVRCGSRKVGFIVDNIELLCLHQRVRLQELYAVDIERRKAYPCDRMPAHEKPVSAQVGKGAPFFTEITIAFNIIAI